MLDEKFFKTDGLKPAGQEFLDKIKGYRDGLIALLDSKEDEALINVIKQRFDTGENDKVKDREGNSVGWVQYNYEGFPYIAAVTKFSQLQSDVRQTEQDFYKAILGEKMQGELSMKHYTTLLEQSRGAYYANQEFDGAIVLGRKDGATKPKKVELTLYNKIEKHYLAKLPDSEEAIITDTTKVVNTLNSLCIEMDNRYSLLKDAMVRNIKEYNAKFKARLLNPNDGHRFLPYIVLIVDEFADLIMTAGKDVELPIARLAQLARAVGIHLIIATQRPSVNVITGLIKANFPARVAFKVSQSIDSKTILDGPGAQRLIGKGDMLYTQGNDLIRIQCAFVDTPEVERIANFIGSQRGYPDAFLLPEYVGEGGENGPIEVDMSKKDPLLKDAAELVVSSQLGSTSMLQRKLEIGFARAGRIMDQLEVLGVVGANKGSKARDVNFPDLISLQQFLDEKGI